MDSDNDSCPSDEKKIPVKNQTESEQMAEVIPIVDSMDSEKLNCRTKNQSESEGERIAQMIPRSFSDDEEKNDDIMYEFMDCKNEDYHRIKIARLHAKKQSIGQFSEDSKTSSSSNTTKMTDGQVDLTKLISGWTVKRQRSGLQIAEVNDRRNRDEGDLESRNDGCQMVDVDPNEAPEDEDASSSTSSD